VADPLTYRADYLDFRRDMVPGLISVMWPSRQRERMAKEALASLRDLAAEPDRLEIGIAFDDDDPQTGEWAAAQDFFTWRTPRLGWRGLGTYFGRLSELSAGEWLVWWGDDGRMLTKGWDTVLREQQPGIPYLHGEVFDNVYPVIHRRALAGIGEVLPVPFVDSWLTEVGKWADCLDFVPISMLEDRFDLTGRNRDQVWEEGSIHAYGPEWDTYCSPPMWARRQEHAWKVKAALGRPGQWATPAYSAR
jgi:hypothetical protein